MPITFDSVLQGEQYDRPTLAALWGYQSWNALGRGIVTPANQKTIILFVTKEKQESLIQYEDHFDGDILYMEGETNHSHDDRLVNAEQNDDKVHLFYRDRHHSSFTYFGEVWLTHSIIHQDKPSRFVFLTIRSTVIALRDSATESSSPIQDDFTPDHEGQKRWVQHITYERSPRNRARAIELQGTSCNCCGFDFDKFYGSELAKSYIEIHHTRSITQIKGPVDPATDLAPLCSNCHSMVHRNRGKVLPIEELKAIIHRNR
jgi:5-methylcytosine-specific restriction protein A